MIAALRHPDAQESAKAAEARLAMLLCNATPERLASFSVDSLVATHRVKLPRCAVMLADERARRG